MVNGFEKETEELTEKEMKEILPLIVCGLKNKIGEKNQISSTEIISKMKERNYKISPARLRKMINYIRTNNLIFNLVASSKGYYIANTPSECRSFIESLDQRINAIITVRDTMKYQLEMSLKN